MKVIVARSAGFCWGVRRAIEKARAVSARSGGAPVFTDGPLIHNEQMIEQLEGEGVRQAAGPDEARGQTLVVRAHGIPPDRRKELQRTAAELVDATCPDVARIQGSIRLYARRGYHVLIYGDLGHAEIVGLQGFAEGRGRVIANAGQVADLPEMDRVCLVAQSTQIPFAYEEVAKAMRGRFPDAVVLDTICASTRNRQTELFAMSADVDAFAVVGGAHSANTLRLFDLARSLRPSFLVQTADQIRPPDFAPFATVGLTAGASTPEFTIEAVRRALEAL
jgi:4-hydroxy-3-methylbut-2-enyl diphosphate reductase